MAKRLKRSERRRRKHLRLLERWLWEQADRMQAWVVLEHCGNALQTRQEPRSEE